MGDFFHQVTSLHLSILIHILDQVRKEVALGWILRYVSIILFITLLLILHYHSSAISCRPIFAHSSNLGGQQLSQTPVGMFELIPFKLSEKFFALIKEQESRIRDDYGDPALHFSLFCQGLIWFPKKHEHANVERTSVACRHKV